MHRGTRVLLLLAVWIGMLAICGKASAQDTFRVTGVAADDVLNMRERPDANASVRGTIPPDGKNVRRIGSCEEWCQVSYGTKSGWVRKQFLRAEPPQVAMVVPTPSADPLGDCNSDDVARKIAGCTALIAASKLPPSNLAIAYSRRSDAHLAHKEYDALIADRTKVLEFEPGAPKGKERLSDAFRLRGEARLGSGAVADAIKDFGNALTLDAANHFALAAQSRAHAQTKDFDGSIADLDAALKLQPELREYAIRLAALHERRGIERHLKSDWTGAIEDYSGALRSNTTSWELFLRRAEARKMRDGKDDLDGALRDYAEAMRLKPDAVEARLGRAEIYITYGSFPIVITDLTEALKFAPNNVPILLLRGLAYEQSEQREKALADYQTSRKLEPGNREANAALERMKGRVER